MDRDLGEGQKRERGQRNMGRGGGERERMRERSVESTHKREIERAGI